ncbi:class GN sortase [Arenimonas sp.]|uniref:class GN sortase n=1 Tax=Arenimonas sp. TaxID=1872635 RepID=UPI0035B32CB2
MNFATTSRMHPRDTEVPPSRRPAPRPRGLRGSAAPARRWLARALLVAALALGLQAAWLPAKAALAQGLLETTWRQSLADGGTHRPWPWADTHAVAKLAAPRLGISQIVLAGDSGRSLAFGPGWAESSATPGAAGTVVISGHRDTHFRWLQDLRQGDVLELQGRAGPRLYEVIGTRVADSRKERIAASKLDQLLLVTCWPFDATAPRGPLRYLVTLRPLPRASSR